MTVVNARARAGRDHARMSLELVCPAGTLPALRAAVDHGADAVYIGFRGATNARNFPGLNFGAAEAEAGIAYAHERGARVFVALNVSPSPANWPLATATIDCAARLGADALILADPGLLRYAADHHPTLRCISACRDRPRTGALRLYRREFGIQRAMLPRAFGARVPPHRAHRRRDQCSVRQS